MKKPDELFQLISTLSRNEKRYFRLFSGLQQGDKTYVDLFDAMEVLKSYDEKEFKSANKDKKFIKNLAWRKHHLYHHVLKALEAYHESIDTQVYSLLHKNEILFEKGLYHQCKKILQKAKELATEYEMYHIIFEILNREDMISSKIFDLEQQKKVIRESRENIRLLSNLTEYKNILQEVYNVHHIIGVFRKPEDEKAMKPILNSPLWNDESAALTFRAKRHYHYSHFLYAFMKGDLEKGFAHTKKCVDLFFAAPVHLTYNSHYFISVINAFLYCCTVLKKRKEMIEYIFRFNEAKKLFVKRSDRAAALLVSYHELGYYVLTGDPDKGMIAAGKIEKEIEEFDDIISPLEKFSLYINLAFTYFLAERYKDSLQWIHKIINTGTLKARADMESMIRIFFIIVQFEKGSSRDFMKSLLRSTYRAMSKREKLFKFEKVILDFIRKKLIKVDSDEKLIASMKVLRNELKTLSKDPYESRLLDYFDLIGWITSKIEDRPFVEIVREKIKGGQP